MKQRTPINRPCRALLLLIAARLLLLLPAHAQLDQRISSDVTVADIPERFSIQAGDSIGRVKLVVWGTSRAVDGKVQGELWRAVVSGNAIAHQPALLSGGDARPEVDLRIMALDRRFIVLWRDARRGVPSIYMQPLDTNGNAIGGEQRIDAPAFALRELWWYGSNARSTLAWYDSAGASLGACLLDSTCTISTTFARFLDGPVRGIYPVAARPGIAIVDRGTALTMIDATAAPVTAPSLLDTFGASWSVSHDGRLARVAGDRVEEFASPFDSAPRRTLLVRYTDDAVPGSLTCAYGGDDRMIATFARARSRARGDRHERIQLALCILHESDGALRAVDGAIVGTVAAPARDCETAICSPDSVSLAMRDRGAREVNVSFGVLTDFDCADSMKRIASERTISYVVTPDMGASTLGDSLIDRPTWKLQRTACATASEVELDVGTKRLRLIAPSAQQAIPVPEETPGISIAGDHLLVGWMRHYADTTAVLRSWYPTGDGPVRLDTFNLTERAIDPAFSDPAATRYALVEADPTFVVAASRSWGEAAAQAIDTLRQLDFLIPTADGWRARRVVDGPAPLGIPGYVSVTADRRGVLAMTWGYGYATMATTLDGDSLWRLDLPYDLKQPASIFALGEGDILVVNRDHISRFRDGTAQYTTIIEGASSPAGAYYLLPGDIILFADFTSQYPGLNTYDLVGNHLRSLNLDGFGSHPPGDYALAVNPVDTTITLLVPGKNGLTALTVDRTLKVIDPPHSASDTGFATAHPGALYRNDTLFIVWEDYREGLPRIYGRAMMRNGAVAEVDPAPPVVDEASAGGEMFETIPNPARDEVHLHVNSASGEKTIDLMDVMGEVLLRRPLKAGESDVTISTAALRSGIYIVRMSSGGISRSRQLRIVR